jgi:sensor histidine kinase regulating citrate/malate metabolism
MHVLITMIRNCCEALSKSVWEEHREKEIVVKTCVEEQQVKIEIVHNGRGMCGGTGTAQGSDESDRTTPAEALVDSCRNVIKADGGTIILTDEGKEDTRISIAFPRISSIR